MDRTFGFECATCGEYHTGMPSFGWDWPVQYLEVPEADRARRVMLAPDACVIDERWFFAWGGYAARSRAIPTLARWSH